MFQELYGDYGNICEILAVSSENVGFLQEPTGIACCQQCLTYAGKQLEDDRTLAQCSVEAGSTLHPVLRLRGGKGGFGALLRGAGAFSAGPVPVDPVCVVPLCRQHLSVDMIKWLPLE